MSCNCENCFSLTGLTNGADGVYSRQDGKWFDTGGVRATGALEGELDLLADNVLAAAEVHCSNYNVEKRTYHDQIFAEIDGNGTPTGVKVLAITTREVDGTVSTSYTNLQSGATWTGNPETELEAVADTDFESDPRTMCDDGNVPFIRWYEMEDGTPTGNVVDTDLAGVAYTPVGVVTAGECVANVVRALFEKTCVKQGEFGAPVLAWKVVQIDETAATRTVVRTELDDGTVVTIGTGATDYQYCGDCC